MQLIKGRAKGKFDELGRVSEDGLEFQVPFAEGQKTGWFFDQTSNRRNLVKYIRKDARMLDVFSYVGAWGVRARTERVRETIGSLGPKCADAALGMG